jgi:hypothetical protein
MGVCGVDMRTKERHTPWQSSTEHAGDSCNVCCVGEERGMLPCLLFLLVVLFSTLANVNGYDMHRDSGSDVERSWYINTSGQSMEDVIRKLAK